MLDHYNHPEWPRPYKVKAGTLMGIIGVAFCLWVLYTSVKAMDKGAWIVLIIYAALGFVLWGYAKYNQKKDPEGWAPVIVSPDTVEVEKEA